MKNNVLGSVCSQGVFGPAVCELEDRSSKEGQSGQSRESVASGRIGMLVRAVLSCLELRVLQYYKRAPLERDALAMIERIYARQRSMAAILLGGSVPVLFSPSELMNLWQQARLMRGHGGAFAEVGAFVGDSAEVICDAKGDTRTYIFEAFKGLPKIGERDGRFTAGAFASNGADLCSRMAGYPSVNVIAGYFPETAAAVEDENFSFVHLDVDLYSSTLASLEFFYPRMRPGGRIICHDYSQCHGVWSAIDEFIVDKPERIEPIGGTQVMILKC